MKFGFIQLGMIAGLVLPAALAQKPGAVVVKVTPKVAQVQAGLSQQFTAVVSGTTNLSVAWSVNGVAGGNSSVGTISSSGMYTAPSNVTAARAVDIKAASAANPGSWDTAKAMLSPVVSVSVTPATVLLTAGGAQQFAAAVTGSTNTAVTWSLSPAVGLITAGGLYTAPVSVKSAQAVTVTATSAADGTKKASAAVTLQAAAAMAVSVSPASATLQAGQAQQFTALVTGTANTAVTWTLNPAVGSLTAGGLYTAPQPVATGQTVTVTATSAADATKSASAVVTLQPAAAAVTVAVSPATASVRAGQAQQFTATVSGTTNTAVSWTLNPAAGTITAGGLYTAPQALEAAQTVTVTATSAADAAKSASAVVTIQPPVVVAVSPATAAVRAGQTQQFTATVSGSSNTAVSWTLNPAAGSITAGGLYTAPASVSATQMVAVTATSAADPSKSAAAAVTLMPPAANFAPRNEGLVSYPAGSMGPNRVNNPGFDTLSATGKPAGWSDNGFVYDATVARSGPGSFRLTDAQLIPYAQSASQDVVLRKGMYSFSGWVKLSGMAATQGGGVRFCLSSSAGSGCTGLVKGTADWQQLSLTKVALSQNATAKLRIEAYGEPDGTAWFDDLEVRQEEIPLEVFLLYPNYRGILFDDQSQLVRFDIAVHPPEGSVYSDYQVNGSITDEATGAVLMQNTLPAAASSLAQFDFSTLQNDRTYLAAFRLVRVSGPPATHHYPVYRLSKVSGAVRASMTVSFDEHNRFLVRGKPTFLLGVYDAGLGYTTLESSWETMLANERRLFELPINLYLNYWYGETPNSSMLPLMNVLQRRGILNMTNANCFAANTVEQMANYWFLQAPASEVQTRTAHPGFAGFYMADECRGDVAPNVFPHSQRARQLNPGGVTWGTMLGDSGLPLWRDTVDVVATDPYPLFSTEPASGYPLNQVADWTRLSKEAVKHSRPVATVLQYFLFTANSRWPTQAELRNMSYMAITEGANGLLYWSLGARALAWVCSGWCETKVDYFNRLKSVMHELKGLEEPLASLDRPELLAGNSNSSVVRTRVKYVNGVAYLIAYNSSAAPAAATFVWAQTPGSVSVYSEGRTITPSANTFSDSFGAYSAHVYVIAPRP